MKKVAKKGWCITAAVMAVSVIVCIFCFVRWVIIPELSEPPVRTLGATIPENESHIFR